MRITQRSMQFGVDQNLQNALARVQDLQEKLSSGRQLERPSDGPASTVSALRYRADLKRADQLQRNADDAQGWLDTTDQALTGGLEILNRARQLLLQGVNGSMSPTDRAAIAQEIDGLRTSVLAIANTTYLGRPVFGGNSTATTAYSAAGTYLGDNGNVVRNIGPTVSIDVNLTGPAAFGPPGADVFAVLAGIADHLRNDPTQLQGDIAALDGAATRMSNAVAAIGARTNQVTSTRDRVESSKVMSTNGLAQVESIDLPATITQLSLQQVAYQAALGATARVIQPSLVDFLR
jgi:flagellar hook-associated protein 3 FlgL